ncbi:hypothetical protein P7C70_g5362, partial [Phenoliferia sp. Uapishka_3]
MSRKVTNRSKGRYPISDALSILHSPSSLIKLNPLVLSYDLLPSNAVDQDSTITTWSIRDSLKLLAGLYTSTTTYIATFEPHPQGTDTVAMAEMGVVSKSSWRVEDDGTIVEEGELEAPWYLMAYVFGQWEASHTRLMERLEETLKERELGTE